MSVLAEFTVPASEFVLADTLTVTADMRIEIKRVAGGGASVTPYFWAAGEDFEGFEAALAADEMVREQVLLEETDRADDGDGKRERFYRVTWGMAVPNLISAVAEAKAAVLEAVRENGDRWEVKVLFPTEAALSEFHEYCTANGFDVEPTRVYRPENPQERAEYGITADQREALEVAYHAGYFAVPRERTLTEIAGDLGISHNALSARLRRGHRNLLRNTIVHEE